ncbi:MAG: DUF1801 domain-containing protein [Methylobacteriaceae bacterium]|nr:DUF1801 domain-containing protein [Methylobacteriaceae bacterium]
MKACATSVAIDEYISSFPADIQQVLQKVRQTIRQAAPMARERMSYNMPTFALDKDIVHFGAFKEHIGFYPPVRDPELQDRIAAYRGEKGNLRFPLDQPIPYDLIGDIVKSRVARDGKRGKPKRKQDR